MFWTNLIDKFFGFATYCVPFALLVFIAIYQPDKLSLITDFLLKLLNKEPFYFLTIGILGTSTFFLHRSNKEKQATIDMLKKERGRNE